MNATCPVISPLPTPLTCPFLIMFMTSYPGPRSPYRFHGKEAHSRLDQPFDKAMILFDQVRFVRVADRE